MLAVSRRMLAVSRRMLAVPRRILAVSRRMFAVPRRMQAVSRRKLAVSRRRLAVSRRRLAVSRRKLAVSRRKLAVSRRRLPVSRQMLAVSRQMLAVSRRKLAVYGTHARDFREIEKRPLTSAGLGLNLLLRLTAMRRFWIRTVQFVSSAGVELAPPAAGNSRCAHISKSSTGRIGVWPGLPAGGRLALVYGS
jgi:hypothetical protein